MSDIPSSIKSLTKGELRYLLRSFIILWIVIALGNLAVARLMMLGTGMDTLTRTSGRNFYFIKPRTYDWPSHTPFGMDWPVQKTVAFYRSTTGFAHGTYANAWDAEGTRFSMEVIQAGVPFATMEIKTTRVFPRHGNAIYAKPPIGTTPGIRVNLLGAVANPTIYAFAAWIFIGFVPVAYRQHRRIYDHRKWVKQSMCTNCGYDILDLPLCPECGTPSHKQPNDLSTN